MDALAEAADTVVTAQTNKDMFQNLQRNLMNTSIIPDNTNVIRAAQPLQQQSNIQTNRTDWHLYLTLEERIFIREKIKKAYRNRTSTFEEMLETCSAIEEELMYVAAPSRLDYFKGGVQFEKRVVEKRKQLSGHGLLEGPVGGRFSFFSQ